MYKRHRKVRRIKCDSQVANSRYSCYRNHTIKHFPKKNTLIFEFFGGIFYISNVIKKVTIKIQNYGSRRLGENSSRG